jgi:hypothetical protein
MIRLGTILLLCSFVFFLAVAPWEECEAVGDACAPICHIFCKDGCTKAPLAAVAASLGASPSVAVTFAYPDTAPGYAAFPPELPPPRV